MRVTFLGHAGILVEAGTTCVMMDPWFSREGAFDASWYQLPANHHLGDRDWSGLDAVIITHEHLDHFDPQFLRSLPATIPLYIPLYPSTLFVRKVIDAVGRPPRVLRTGVSHTIGDLEVRTWTEPSPMNQDSAWVLRHGAQSIVHLVDSRLTPDQLDEIVTVVGAKTDLMLVQCAGASWFPLAYENYDAAEKHARALRKREQKLSYAHATAERLQPTTLACCAGPPAFLDDTLRSANADPSFPTPGDARTWFGHQSYARRVIAPLPGDALEVTTGALDEDAAMHAEFSWPMTASYIERYAERMRPHIEEVYRRADDLPVEDLDAAFTAHFQRMLALSPYFNRRIAMTLCLDIEGPDDTVWLVDFGEGTVRRGQRGDDHQYRYRFHGRWLKRILTDGLRWEDFLLSLRFTAARNPDIYNDHLLGVLKFNDSAALKAVEEYENVHSDETIVVETSDGNRYEIARFCPHAGAALDHAPIVGHVLTCLNHHYDFDLDTGKCLSGNCTLRTKRLGARS